MGLELGLDELASSLERLDSRTLRTGARKTLYRMRYGWAVLEITPGRMVILWKFYRQDDAYDRFND